MDQTREKEVWSRVMAASANAPMPQARNASQPKRGTLTGDRLRELMQDEAQDAHTYRQLAARSQGSVRRTLEQISGDEQNHYRQLGAVSYLETGRRPVMERPHGAPPGTVAEALRAQYPKELEGAETYHRMAETAGPYAAVFHEMGNDEERHARMIIKLLAEML